MLFSECVLDIIDFLKNIYKISCSRHFEIKSSYVPLWAIEINNNNKIKIILPK